MSRGRDTATHRHRASDPWGKRMEWRTEELGGSRRAEPPSLRRVLGLLEVTAGGVGIIIGAGIYVLLGAATAEAGSLVWVAFLGAATLSALTGLSYAELSSCSQVRQVSTSTLVTRCPNGSRSSSAGR